MDLKPLLYAPQGYRVVSACIQWVGVAQHITVLLEPEPRPTSFPAIFGAPYEGNTPQPADPYSILKETTMLPRLTFQTAQPRYFIVVSNEGPSQIPHRHPNHAEATAEAERLARLHPEKTFTVFASISAHTAPWPAVNTIHFA